MFIGQISSFLAQAGNDAQDAGGNGLNIIFVMGIAVFCGTIGAKLFQKLKIPQVVGYVMVGLVAGKSVLNIITYEMAESLSLFNLFALGIIGFMIGGEIRKDVFKKYGRQFIFILISEAIGAFILVGILCSATCWLITKDINTSVAIGIVLAAIASATAPAATVNVLWEYKTRGPLTSAIMAIVAMDDGLSLLLFGIASSVALAFIGGGDETMLHAIGRALLEIIGGIVLGFTVGIVLHFILNRIKEADKKLAFIVASVMLVVGISVYANLSPILAAMSLGITIANAAPERKKGIFELLEKFSPPIYALFFVLAGAHLVFRAIKPWMVIMIIVYLIARTTGKISGAWFGGKYTKAAESIRKYLGLCLLSQAGVAIGLAIISSHLFGGEAGQAIIVIIMCTTFVVEILGPLCVKIGVKKAGEVGLNITEQDLIETRKVSDVISTEIPVIKAGTQLNEVINVVSNTNSYFYPVIDNEEKIMGVVTLDGIRNTFNTQELNEWLVALDVAEPIVETITSEMTLENAFSRASKKYLKYIPVVRSKEEQRLVGLFDVDAVHRSLAAEVLSRQQKADTMHTV